MSKPRIWGPPLLWAVVASVVLAGVAWVVTAQGQRIDSQGTRISGLEQQRNAANEQARTLADQVRRLGGVPVVSPPPQPTPARSGAQGRTGATGTPGRPPTQAEVSAAVAAYLRANPPPRGRAPTMAEIITAVSGYLTQNPPPAGPAGAKGDEGDPGETGATGPQGDRGEQGPPPTDEQVRTAVAAFFAAHTLTCTPEEPAGGVTGGSFRCSISTG